MQGQSGHFVQIASFPYLKLSSLVRPLWITPVPPSFFHFIDIPTKTWPVPWEISGISFPREKTSPEAMAHVLHFSISPCRPPPPFLSKRLSSKPYACSASRSSIPSVHSMSTISESRLPLPESPAPVILQPTTEDSGVMHVDAVTAAELRENGLRSSRRTKLVCTIGPATCGLDDLEALAAGGMNVARLNMCHGTREWHRTAIERVRWLNEVKGFAVSIMMDTEGSEVHMGDLGGLTSAKAEDGDIWTFSVRAFDSHRPECTISVNYDGFSEDVKVGDELLVDGGMVRFEVIDKIGPDVKCRCTDPGLLLPCANLTFWRNGSLVQARNAMLPTISSKDWLDIDFGISEGVDFIAVSFVKSAEVIKQLKSYIAGRSCKSDVAVIAKIESFDSLKNLEDIIQASDGAMVARGDLGAQVPLEEVPSIQEKIIQLCRQLNKPVIVASQFLESMIEYPTPTRAEVADVSEAVKQQADGLMLSGESAMGQYPEKALAVLTSVSLRIERWWREEKHNDNVELPDFASTSLESVSEEICHAATKMANKLEADAIFVYTRTGHMATLLSRCRPDCPVFAFTPRSSSQRRLNLYWGLIPICLNFSNDMESNLDSSISLLKARGMIKSGDLIISVSDMLQSVQVMNVP